MDYTFHGEKPSAGFRLCQIYNINGVETDIDLLECHLLDNMILILC